MMDNVMTSNSTLLSSVKTLHLFAVGVGGLWFGVVSVAKTFVQGLLHK